MYSYQEIRNKPTAFLRKVLPFSKLNEAELRALSKDLRLKKYAKNDIICHQGLGSRRLYIIVEGKVRVFTYDPTGKETMLNLLSTYDIIGEFVTLDDKPRTAIIKAIDDCLMLEMDSERFLQHLHHCPNLSLGICRLLAQKIRWATNYTQAIARYDTIGRLLYIVLSLNQRFGEPEKAGKRYLLDISLKQEELASLVGVKQEWISQTFDKLGKKGLMKYQKEKIIILDLPQVEDELSKHVGIFDAAGGHLHHQTAWNSPLSKKNTTLLSAFLRTE